MYQYFLNEVEVFSLLEFLLDELNNRVEVFDPLSNDRMQCNSTRFTTGTLQNFLCFIKITLHARLQHVKTSSSLN